MFYSTLKILLFTFILIKFELIIEEIEQGSCGMVKELEGFI